MFDVEINVEGNSLVRLAVAAVSGLCHGPRVEQTSWRRRWSLSCPVDMARSRTCCPETPNDNSSSYR